MADESIVNHPGLSGKVAVHSSSEKDDINRGQPGSLRRINIETIVRKVQTDAPITRADLVRATELSYPTVTKICDLLLENNLAEWVAESGQESSGRGRPAPSMQMAHSASHVIALSFRPTYIIAATSSLDGRIIQESQCLLPSHYTEILETAHQMIRDLQEATSSPTLGLGLAAPGVLEIGSQTQLSVSTDIPALTRRYIATDLSELTKLPTVLVSTMRALYNSESIRGQATEHKNFAILNYYAGMGLAVACNDTFVDGSHGMAGELGHIIMQPDGELCGCGNRGCLETLSTDSALARSIGKKLGRRVEIEEIDELIASSPEEFAAEIDHMLEYLAVAVGATINIFNPEAVLLYGRLLEIDDYFLDKLKEKMPSKCLKTLASKCVLKKSKARTIEGAALAIAEELTSALSSQL